MNPRPDMRDFRQLAIPDLSTIPVVRPGGACPDGMLSCPDLNRLEIAATDKMLKFATQMAQGFSGYVAIMDKNTQVYEDGAARTAEEMRVACTYAPSLVDGPLPDVAPELSAPGPRDG